MSDALERSEFIAGYVAEAREHLVSANASLLAIDEAARRGDLRPRAVRELFRSLHTLKGVSAMIGAEPIVDLAHEMENLLRSADRAGGRLAKPAIDLLLQGVRAVEVRVASLAEGKPVAAAPAPLMEALAAVERPEHARARGELALPPEIDAKLGATEREELLRGIAAGRRACRVDFVPSPEKAAQGIHITAVRQRVGALGDLVKVLPRAAGPGEDAPAGLAFVLLLLTDASDESIAAAADAPLQSVQLVSAKREPVAEEPVDEAEDRGLARHVIRVDVSRLDDALERLSALVVTRSRLQRVAATLAERGADVRELRVVLQEHAAQLRRLRAAILRARMVPVSELLERAPLIVRGLSQTSGKSVRLRLDAGNAELDKSVGDRLFSAIVHLLRNAVDHAIEPPAERRRAGKPEEGSIHVSCREASNAQLELVVEDDGRGIDRESVARRAGRADALTDADLLDIIARPGFSTVEEPTRTSGRGVGMDVVKRITVRDLGGELRLETQRGKGSRFTLRVPLSITIVDAFAFACGGQTFVVPVSSVEDLMEIDDADVVPTPHPGALSVEARVVRRRAAPLPLVRLDAVLGLPAAQRGRPKAIVVRRDGDLFAFEVDRMLGQQEVVVRPMADPLVSVAGVAGTTDLGDGRPTLVLDLGALTASLQRRGAAAGVA